jgi:hypothetical protein
MLLTGLGMGVFNPPRASLSIAVAEPSQAGMASGISETFQQVGTAVGIAVIGAVFQTRVGYHLDQSPAAAALGSDGGSIVAASGGSQIVRSVADPGLAAQLAQVARMAFVDGLTDVMVIAAAAALVASVVGVFFIRRKDLHESAL